MATITALLADGRRDAALEHFMRTAGSSDESIAGARASAYWPGLLRLAHTLAYDAACSETAGRHKASSSPCSCSRAAVRGSSRAPPTRCAEALPNAERETIPNQGHVADPKAMAPVLERFFR